MDDDAVIDAVTQIHGIGDWTAHMLLMFSLGRPDVLPVGDYGVRKGAMQLYGLRDLPEAEGARDARRAVAPVSQRRVVVPVRVVDTIAPGA
jgi:3-methyladenine DNA glycosylase/8-oxoguanine DNA glycosylase